MLTVGFARQVHNMREYLLGWYLNVERSSKYLCFGPGKVELGALHIDA